MEEGGALQRLLREQEGELCGPRPQPPLLQGMGMGMGLALRGGSLEAEGNSAQDGAGSSYLLNCRDLASYLHQMPRLAGPMRSV